MYIEIILHSHFTSTQSISRYGNVEIIFLIYLFVCHCLWSVHIFFKCLESCLQQLIAI
jgi:hypothetical protein